MRKQIWTRLSAAVMASLLTATPPSGAIALEYVTSLPFVESAATQPLVQTLMATGVPYLDETGTPQTAANATEIQSNTTTWSNGWYVVHGDVTINGQVTVSGDVHLILADYANLTVNGGIFVKKDNHLHLYAQSTGADMGTLTTESQKEGNAGIGGGQSQGASGIAVHGDDITAIDGNDAADMEDAAKASTGKTVIELGTSKIQNPVEPLHDISEWTGNYVYFGTHEGKPVKYRMLANETTDFSQNKDNKTMLLDCDNILVDTKNPNNNKFASKPDSVYWKDSNLKQYLNGDFFNNSFTKQEQSAIIASHKSKASASDGDSMSSSPSVGTGFLPKPEFIPLTGEKIFPLDILELRNTTYGYRNPDGMYNKITSSQKKLRFDNDNTPDINSYWTRTPSHDLNGYFDPNAPDAVDPKKETLKVWIHCNKKGPFGYQFNILHLNAENGAYSPAFNVNLSSVLFASQLPNTNADTDTGNEYTLTLLDTQMTIQQGSGDITRVGDTITIPYTIDGANKDNAKKVSVLFLDKQYNATDTKNTNVLGYAALNGKLQDSTGTLTLPADLSDQEYGKDYYAYLVAETDNGEKRTNSASTPTQITIPPKPWTDAGSITINGGSVTAAGGTNAAGIGGGYSRSAGTVTINGGSVTATGGTDAAGIGSGNQGSGGSVTISGGSVTATGGTGIVGIGDGTNSQGSTFSTGTNGQALIISTGGISDKSSQDNWSGMIFDDSAQGKVYGSAFTLRKNLEIPAGKTLTIPSNVTLTVDENVTLACNTTLTNDGTIQGTSTAQKGTLDGTGELTGSGTVDHTTIENRLRKASAVSVTVTPSSIIYDPNVPTTITMTADISKATNTFTRAAEENHVEFFVGTGDQKKSLGKQAIQGDTATLDNVNVEISSEKGFVIGENIITAEYGGSMVLQPQSGTAALTISEKSVDKIEIIQQPKLSYTRGDKLDLNGLSVQVSYNTQTTETITWDSGKLTASPAHGTELTVAGQNGKTVTISYGGKTAETNRLIVEKAAQVPLSITGAPDKIYQGNSFTLQTSGGSGNGAVAWSVVSGPVTVDANGNVMVTGTGEFQIKALKHADEEYYYAESVITLTAVKKNSGGGGGNSGGSTVTKPDDTTESEITKHPDGSTTTTDKTPNGTTGTVTTDKNGNVTEVEGHVSDKDAEQAQKDDEPVKLPVIVPVTPEGEKAPNIEIELPEGSGSIQIEIPVKKPTTGTVVIVVKPNGEEVPLQQSIVTDNSVIFPLDGSAVIKIVDRSRYFLDVHGVNHWATAHVDFVTARDLFYGTSDTHFSPEHSMTRGMLVTVLYRLAGSPNLPEANLGYPFRDVTLENWYSDAVYWATYHGIVSGYHDGRFGPNDNITREQMATILYRYAQYKGYNIKDQAVLDKFSDFEQVNSWSSDALSWANAKNLIVGTSATTLTPNGSATRAQVAAIFSRFVNTFH